MTELIACISKRNEVFYAHNIDIRKRKLYSNFGCGNCMTGRIRLNRFTRKINKKECDICGSRFELNSA